MEYTYFPVTLAQLGATIRYHDLVEGSFTVGDVRVVAKYLNHPALALGYRLEADGAAVVYASDHEPHVPSAPRTAWRARRGAAGASRGPAARRVPRRARTSSSTTRSTRLEEYREKVGWGHTPAECAVDYAIAGARADGSRSTTTTH